MEKLKEINSYLSKQDERLKRIINQVKLPEYKSSKSVFNDLLSCVIEQQIHYRSSKRIFDKMLVKSNISILSLDNFNDFEKLALSESKLSIKKYETINEVVTFFNKNKINWNSLSDFEVKEVLSSIKGIGPWSINMILLYTLKRENIVPYSDFHLKQIMSDVYNIESKLKKSMTSIAENWEPYSSYAVKYLLEYKKLKRGIR